MNDLHSIFSRRVNELHDIGKEKIIFTVSNDELMV